MIRISYDMEIYRKHLNESLKKADIVIELGCHIGKTTEIIAQKNYKGKIIAIDNSPEAIEKMELLSNRFPNIDFISGDVRLHNTLEKIAKKIDFCDILSVDLGGGYHPDTVFKVYYIWASVFKPKITLIRNKGLVDFVKSSRTEELIKSNHGWLESCKDEGIPPQIKEFKLWSSSLNAKKED